MPQRVGITWFRLGNEPRVPFHLHFANDEAKELMDVAIKLEKTAIVMMKLGMEVDTSETQELILSLTPNLKTSDKNGGLIFFQKLEDDQSDSDSEDSSAPSREDIKAMQGFTSAHKKELEDLVEGIKVPKDKNELEVVNDERSKIGKASVNISQ